VKSNKNDFLDAEAIAEAADRQNMHFVPIKTDDQLDLQALHRVRDRLITRRTSVINQLRAFLLERGLVFAESPAKLRERMPEILENAEEGLTPRVRNLLALLWNEWKDLEQQVVDLNHEVELIASSDAACLRLRHRQRRCVPQGARVRRVDGPSAEAVLDRRQGKTVRHQ
jgi:transposase